MPGLLDVDALQNVLTALGVRPTAPPSTLGPPERLAAGLAFSLVGVAESQAMAAQQAARDAGTATPEDIALLTAETLGAANCQSELDALDLLRWRAGCLSQALGHIDLGGPWGVTDPMMHAIVITAGALAGLMTAAHQMRDPASGPSDTHDAAEGWWTAIGSLGEVAHMSATQSTDPGCRDQSHDGCGCDAPVGTA